jgi:hypothetical protein
MFKNPYMHKHLHVHFFCVFCWFGITLTSIFPLHQSDASSVSFSMMIRPLPECQNRIDDDSDGFVDFPLDTDCEDENDALE